MYSTVFVLEINNTVVDLLCVSYDKYLPVRKISKNGTSECDYSINWGIGGGLRCF